MAASMGSPARVGLEQGALCPPHVYDRGRPRHLELSKCGAERRWRLVWRSDAREDAVVQTQEPQPAQQVDEIALQIIQQAPNGEGVEVFGPAPAPIAVLRGRHRRRFLVKSPKNIDLSAYMAAWIARLRLPNAVRMSVDIDPYSFL